MNIVLLIVVIHAFAMFQDNGVAGDLWLTPVLYQNSDGDVQGILFQEVTNGFESQPNFGDFTVFFMIGGNPNRTSLDLGFSSDFEIAKLKNYTSLSWIVYRGGTLHDRIAARHVKQLVNGIAKYADSESLSLYLSDVQLDEITYNTVLALKAKVLILENIRVQVDEKTNSTITWQEYSRNTLKETIK